MKNFVAYVKDIRSLFGVSPDRLVELLETDYGVPENLFDASTINKFDRMDLRPDDMQFVRECLERWLSDMGCGYKPPKDEAASPPTDWRPPTPDDMDMEIKVVVSADVHAFQPQQGNRSLLPQVFEQVADRQNDKRLGFSAGNLAQSAQASQDCDVSVEMDPPIIQENHMLNDSELLVMAQEFPGFKLQQLTDYHVSLGERPGTSGSNLLNLKHENKQDVQERQERKRQLQKRKRELEILCAVYIRANNRGPPEARN